MLFRSRRHLRLVSSRRSWLDGPPRPARSTRHQGLDLRIPIGLLAVLILLVGLLWPGGWHGPFLGSLASPTLHCEPAVLVPSCYDGDTCTAYLDGRREDVRLVGFDTPEINGNARCRQEHDLGLQARDRLRGMIGAARERAFCHRSLDDYERDRYGRVLAVLQLDGRDVAEAMIEGGLAVPFPLGFEPDWCRQRRR